MKHKLCLKIAIYCYSFVYLYIATNSYAYQPENSQQFAEINEIIKLVKLAKEAGFSDEELDEIILKNDGQQETTIVQSLDDIQEIESITNINPQLLQEAQSIPLGKYKLRLIELLPNTKEIKKPIFFSSSDVKMALAENQKSLLAELSKQ